MVERLLRALQEGQWFALGVYYGYPLCCIDEFKRTTCSGTKELYRDEAEWTGTGYLPCLSCARKIQNQGFSRFVEETIAPNRISSVAFPDDSLANKKLATVLDEIKQRLSQSA